jgi:hypothetical protein
VTKEQKTKKIHALMSEALTLLAEMSPQPPPKVRMISEDEMPQQVRTWLIEQIRRLDTEKSSPLH